MYYTRESNADVTNLFFPKKIFFPPFLVHFLVMVFVVVVVFVLEISFTPAPPSTPVNVAGKTSLAFAKASITAVQSVGMSDIEGMCVGTNPCEEAAAAAPSAANPPTYGKLILLYTLLSLSLSL